MNLNEAIHKRKTTKVIPNAVWPEGITDKKLKALVSELLELASFAPYHYMCNDKYIEEKELNSCVPYRVYILDTQKCRMTATFLEDHNIKSGKIQQMLEAADMLFVVTWLPEPSTDTQDGVKRVNFEGNLKNMEHISATAAAIQNMLLGATAKGIPNYWSSGGKLRESEVKKHLGIPEDEVILGTVFLFPEDSEERDAKIIPGGLRSSGKLITEWSKYL